MAREQCKRGNPADTPGRPHFHLSQPQAASEERSAPGEIERATRRDLTGAIGAQSARGETRGLDYRGEQVLAAYRPIAGSGWHLIAKIDQREVLAQLWTLVFWVSMVVLLAIAAVSVVLLLLWRQQRRAHQLALRFALRSRIGSSNISMSCHSSAWRSPRPKPSAGCDSITSYAGFSVIPGKNSPQKIWVEMTHPEDIEKDIAEFDRVMHGESEGYAMNKRFIRKDGSIVMANVDVKCVRRDDGTVKYFVAMVRDITEQERRKAEILAARSQLQATLDAIPDLLFELDLDGRCHAYHSPRTDLPTSPVEEPARQKISDVLPPGAAEIIVSALREAKEKGLSSGKQLELQFPQGTSGLNFPFRARTSIPGWRPDSLCLRAILPSARRPNSAS